MPKVSKGVGSMPSYFDLDEGGVKNRSGFGTVTYPATRSAESWDPETLNGRSEPVEAERREVRVARPCGDPLRDRLAEAGRVLEPVSGTRRHEQNPGEVRVIVDDEVRVRGDRVEASRRSDTPGRDARETCADQRVMQRSRFIRIDIE